MNELVLKFENEDALNAAVKVLTETFEAGVEGVTVNTVEKVGDTMFFTTQVKSAPIPHVPNVPMPTGGFDVEENPVDPKQPTPSSPPVMNPDSQVLETLKEAEVELNEARSDMDEATQKIEDAKNQLEGDN